MTNDRINLDSLELKIKDIGFKLTVSRKAILNIIANTENDLTAEEIYILTHKKDPKIGIATVYRNIRLLEKLGLVEKSYYGDNKAKYKFTNKTSISEKNKFFKLKDNKLNDYQDIDRINKIQIQLKEWITELNKMKSEKEIELEEIINDFGKIDKILEKHEFKENNLIQMLLDFQSEYNWLPKHVLFYTGNKLNITLTQIYSIASFYKFFNLEPRGKYQVIVCAGTACHVRGSINLLQRIINILSIKPGETTRDYKFTLDTVNCLGCCALGPVMVLKDMYYSNPSSKQLEKLFNEVD
ncbi:MAG: NAD(P)H-dependent oxidoreductase subunit E [Nitrososphaeraceae archaeon]